MGNDIRNIVELAKAWGIAIAEHDAAEKSGDVRAACRAWDNLYDAHANLLSAVESMRVNLYL